MVSVDKDGAELVVLLWVGCLDHKSGLLHSLSPLVVVGAVEGTGYWGRVYLQGVINWGIRESIPFKLYLLIPYKHPVSLGGRV